MTMAEDKRGDIRVRLTEEGFQHAFLTPEGWVEIPIISEALTIHRRDGGISVEYLDE
jgi:hypothetical protein